MGRDITPDFLNGIECQCLCDGLSRSLAGFVVNCHKKVFTQFVRRAETDERQETDTRVTRVLTQLSTRLSPLHFTGKVAIPHALSLARYRLTVNYLHFGY